MFYFFKMQALGNDFIVINNLEKKIEYSYKLLCQYLCNRNFGVGADGVLILERSEITNFKMRIFNQDGSEAEMCGNGIRCLAKYIYENKLINKNEFEIETLSGIRKVKIYLDEKAVKEIEVDMGKPKFNLDEIPVIYLENSSLSTLSACPAFTSLALAALIIRLSSNCISSFNNPEAFSIDLLFKELEHTNSPKFSL